ncbi:nucleolar protein 6-like, partial [Limulus polyphemus]|uniref:Nucleolar protein 6-like n=1 Tax=Limulus polyphemus TaxID=6850 RepID=A0ABM1RZK6_LIMPO
MPGIISLLKKGLGKRIHTLDVQCLLTEMWTSAEDPPNPNYDGEILIGILMNQDYATNILDKGPPADSPEVKLPQKNIYLIITMFWGTLFLPKVLCII